MKYYENSCLYVSLILHAFIIFPWYGIKENETIEHVPSVHAYIVSSSHENIQLKKELNHPQPKGFIKNTPLKQANKTQKQSYVFNDSENEKQVIHRKLLQMLHEQIAKHQVYPENALELNQNGIVTIYFILNSKGVIADAVIEKSSGIKSLDLAALNAVTASSPLKNVDKYIKNNEKFSIDIMYR
ncbi:MAG: TonB family protein [Gammaproteobacteria bacterium]|nr:TonB family protein [Gammaproteobacteria bacterium]